MPTTRSTSSSSSRKRGRDGPSDLENLLNSHYATPPSDNIVPPSGTHSFFVLMFTYYCLAKKQKISHPIGSTKNDTSISGKSSRLSASIKPTSVGSKPDKVYSPSISWSDDVNQQVITDNLSDGEGISIGNTSRERLFELIDIDRCVRNSLTSFFKGPGSELIKNVITQQLVEFQAGLKSTLIPSIIQKSCVPALVLPKDTFLDQSIPLNPHVRTPKSGASQYIQWIFCILNPSDKDKIGDFIQVEPAFGVGDDNQQQPP